MRPLILALVALVLSPFAAADGITVELNKLEVQGEACRAYLVFQNATGTTLEELKLDLVLFGDDGVINRRLALAGAGAKRWHIVSEGLFVACLRVQQAKPYV